VNHEQNISFAEHLELSSLIKHTLITFFIFLKTSSRASVAGEAEASLRFAQLGMKLNAQPKGFRCALSDASRLRVQISVRYCI
jgi:hypothetical protein